MQPSFRLGRLVALLSLPALPVLALAATSCHSAVPVRLGVAHDRVVVRDVRVVDGTGGATQEHMDVLLRGTVIDAVVPTGNDPPTGAFVVEGAGRTLLPGFIDAHVHVTANAAIPGQPGLDAEGVLARYLQAGVTTVVDLGGSGPDLAGLAERVSDGTFTGPRIQHSNMQIIARGGHPLPLLDALVPWPLSWLSHVVMPQVEHPRDVERALTFVQEMPVEFVKIVADAVPEGSPEMSIATLTAAVQAARQRGLIVFVHAGSVEQALAAAGAGAQVLAHLPWRGRFSTQDAVRLAALHTVVIPTLTVWEAADDLARGAWEPTPLDTALQPRALMEGARGPAAKRAVEGNKPMASFARSLREQRAHWRASLQALREAGVPIVVGTDSPLPGTYPGSSFHRELQALQGLGYSPAELIVAATSRSAGLLPETGEVGSIQKGKLADLVLVEGDPLADIADAGRIALVIRGGQMVELDKGQRPSPSSVP